MTQTESKQLVADTGRLLLQKGLVARTWGNISARVDEKRFAISPSGLGYEYMTGDDVPVFNFEDGSWEGKRKPSSEKKIHAAAYARFTDVTFVIHTHQDYATAVGLLDGQQISDLPFTAEEKAILGEVRVAGYGLPGTKQLKQNVDSLFQNGCKAVLMKHHGAILLGKDREDAFLKAETLENACKRFVNGALHSKNDGIQQKPSTEPEKQILAVYPNAEILKNDYIAEAAADGGFRCQLDDLAQMIGPKLPAVSGEYAKVVKALKKHPAVLVKGMGCVVAVNSEDDREALKLLIQKAAISYVFTKRNGIKIALSYFDCKLMQLVFKYKYARKKAK